MSKLPPGPFNFLTFLGLTFRHYFGLRSDPIAFSTRLGKKYGDISFFRILTKRVILVNHPELIREVLVRQAENFPKFNRIINHLQKATGDGLLVTEGEKWREQRIMIQKVFRSNQVDVYGDLTSRYTLAMIDRWKDQKSVRVEEEMTRLLQAIMGKAFFGIELNPGHEIAKAVRIYSDIFHYESRSIISPPDWFPSKMKKDKRASITILRDSLGKIVADRIQSGERREDLLDLLLHSGCPHSGSQPKKSSSESIAEEAVNQLLTMYVAGFHTTSVALAWLFYCVARHPKVQNELHRQITEVSGWGEDNSDFSSGTTYVDQVIKESLRLYPAAWELFARNSVKATELGGYRIPAGTLTMICPIVTHRDPRFFSRPEEFDPNRFSPEMEDKIAPFSYLPFGMGAHQCIGNSLAMMQLRLVLVHVLRNYEISLEDPSREVRMVAGVSARPQGDIELILKKRNVKPIDPGAGPAASKAHAC